MSIYEFFILDSLNSFLLMSFLASSTFFTILGIYLRHKPSQVVTAVVKKTISEIWYHLGSNFRVFWKRGKKKQFDQKFKHNWLPNWVTIYWFYISLELPEKKDSLNLNKIIKRKCFSLVRAKNIFANNLVPKVD